MAFPFRNARDAGRANRNDRSNPRPWAASAEYHAYVDAADAAAQSRDDWQSPTRVRVKDANPSAAPPPQSVDLHHQTAVDGCEVPTSGIRPGFARAANPGHARSDTWPRPSAGASSASI